MDYQDDAIEERNLDGRPLTSYAEYLHQLNSGNPDAGVQRARVNLDTLMGGFHRFRDKGRPNEAQERAVSILKAAWERSVVGGARAIDPSVEPVDGGYRNPEAVFEQGVDARALKLSIEAHLGAEDTGRLAQVAIAGRGPTSYAKWRYGSMNKPNQRHISAGIDEVRAIAARLAAFLELAGEGAASRGTRVQRENTPTQFTGQVSTRRAG